VKETSESQTISELCQRHGEGDGAKGLGEGEGTWRNFMEKNSSI